MTQDKAESGRGGQLGRPEGSMLDKVELFDFWSALAALDGRIDRHTHEALIGLRDRIRHMPSSSARLEQEAYGLLAEARSQPGLPVQVTLEAGVSSAPGFEVSGTFETAAKVRAVLEEQMEAEDHLRFQVSLSLTSAPVFDILLTDALTP